MEYFIRGVRDSPLTAEAATKTYLNNTMTSSGADNLSNVSQFLDNTSTTIPRVPFSYQLTDADQLVLTLHGVIFLLALVGNGLVSSLSFKPCRNIDS